MLGSNPHCDFIPLRTQDPENRSINTQDITDVDNVVQPQLTRRVCLCMACIWTICSATALLTTKRLMLTHGYHYPLTISLHSFAAILIAYIIYLHIASESSNTPGKIQWGLRQLSGNDLLVNKYWAVMLPASLAAAAAFPMLLEGLLHMPSLLVIIMLFPLIYATESVILFIRCSPSRSQKWLPWEAILVTFASGIVLYSDYSLMVPGLICGVGGVLLIGLSRASFVIGMERSGSELAIEARLKAAHGFVVMTLLFGLLFSGLAAYRFEHIHSMHPLEDRTKVLMVVNIASVLGTAFSGTSVMVYSPISFHDSRLHFSNIPISGIELLTSLASSLLVGLASVHCYPRQVSWIQILACLVATACLAGADQIHNLVLICLDNRQKRFDKLLGKEIPEPGKKSRVLISGALLAFIILLSCTLSSLSNASINSLPASLPATLDLAYEPESKFDIVISIYQESPASIKSIATKLKSTTYLSTISSQVQVIIYTKDEAADLEALEYETGADIVLRLPNTGREGGTYLHHIVSNWDSLAEKTMFIQAHPHNMRELIPRINSYLFPQTGMLSLGFTGITCDCNSCSDRWGWEDKWAVVPTLYGKIYGTPCESNQAITLSYKGQFVASAKRIRGIDKKIYQGLLDAITSQNEWVHNATTLALGGNGEDMVVVGDSPRNPYFGFTVERVWDLLMQCGTDARVAARCPSLLSGMGRSGEVGDCQCLDER